MNSFTIEVALLILLVSIMIMALVAHLHYFIRVTNHIKRSSPEIAFQRRDLMAAMRIIHGSNFYTLILISWLLFFVNLAFFYFLTPGIFSNWNYFNFPQIASDNLGLAYFGIAVMILPGILVALFVPRCYSYYLIPVNSKRIVASAPIFLIISISCSIFLGTIYPRLEPSIWFFGYGTLLISLVLMLAPIMAGYIEEMRT